MGGDEEACLQTQHQWCGAGGTLRLLDHTLFAFWEELLIRDMDIFCVTWTRHVSSYLQGTCLTSLPLRVTVSWKWSDATENVSSPLPARRTFPLAPRIGAEICTVLACCPDHRSPILLVFPEETSVCRKTRQGHVFQISGKCETWGPASSVPVSCP